MKNFGFMIAAIVLGALLIIPAFIGQIIRHIITDRKLGEFWFDVAIGIDQLGGAILYGEPDWTVSSRTYFLAQCLDNLPAIMFMRLIDRFFGKEHCKKSYENEFGNKGEEL